MKTIYLDNNATTAISPEVLNEMLPYLKEFYGNPSSIHSFGRNLYYKIEQAREKVALLIGAEPEEIIFTSCGTESDNMAMGMLKAMFAAGATKHFAFSPRIFNAGQFYIFNLKVW